MNKAKLAAVGAFAAGLVFAGSASAAVIVGAYTLDSGSFGTGEGVHSLGTQTNVSSANAFVNQDGSAVTFTSTGLFDLQVNGSGEATVVGDPSLANLTVSFAKTWGMVTFDFETPTSAPDSTMSLLVNGVALFSGNVCGALCGLSNGANKFILTGPDIQTLTFNFDPAIADGKQFRVDVPASTGVPEPGLWTLMIVGIGVMGGAMRLRRSRAPDPAIA
jgi:hypothetical protein